jgi:hypothetical protein
MKKTNEEKRGQHCPKKLNAYELLTIRGGDVGGESLPPDRGKSGN